MLSAENSSKLSAQSPAWSRKALPAATRASSAWQRSGLAGEHERRHGGDLLQRLFERGGVGPVGLLAAGRSCQVVGVQRCAGLGIG